MLAYLSECHYVGWSRFEGQLRPPGAHVGHLPGQEAVHWVRYAGRDRILQDSEGAVINRQAKVEGTQCTLPMELQAWGVT
jgi:hypothetical protein